MQVMSYVIKQYALLLEIVVVFTLSENVTKEEKSSCINAL